MYIGQIAKRNQQKKAKLISKASLNMRSKLESVFSKIQKLADRDIAFSFGQQIVSNDEAILLYDQMKLENLQQEVGFFISMMQNPERQGNKNLMKEQNENPFKKESKVCEMSMKILQKQKQQQQPKYHRIIQQIKKALPNYKQFIKKFTLKNFQQFIDTFVAYETQQVILKSQLLEKIQRVKKGQRKNSFFAELHIVDSALYHSSKNHRLRVTQALSIYCFLYYPESTKFVLQILTGEGKTTTISCLAAILIMRGRIVDIVTTNKILAIRDVNQKRSFYSLLGINTNHNIPPQQTSTQLLSPRKCYQKGTIVYGTPFSYQVDLLYDQYKKKGTRNLRSYDVVIVDQVDSLFVDEKQNQTLLSSTFVGFSELREPLKMIWQTVVTHNVVRQNGKLYFLKYGQNQGQIIKGESSAVINLMINDLREKFKNEVINSQKREYIQMSIQKWILSAIQAAHFYKEDKQYKILKGKIIPIDYSNTGCLQKNVEWQHGLHQFLQLKHGLQVSIEGLTSNYMSNIGFFSRYKSIFGLTGTLGSKKSMLFLWKTYQVQMMEIPPFKQRKLKLDPGYVMYDNFGWINKIRDRCEVMIKNKRSVLLICQSIQNVKHFSSFINQKIKQKIKIKVVQTGQQQFEDIVKVGQIIVATNVAGRGTDLKPTQSLINNGGLHVIVTFMPSNLRVQMQARGRAGRSGAPGSSQLIVNLTSYFNTINKPVISKQNYQKLGFQNKLTYLQEEIRDKLQLKQMENDQQRVEQMKTRDKMFEIFCKATNQVFDYQSNKAKRNAIQQEWAMFLKRTQQSHLTNQEKIDGAKQFADAVCTNSQAFYKKSHGVLRGINQLNKNNLGEAKKHFRSTQNEDCSLNMRISGSIMMEKTAIMKKKSFEETIGLIQNKIQILKGLKFKDLTLQNSHINQLLEKRQNQKQEKVRQSFSIQNHNQAQRLTHSNSKKQNIQICQKNRIKKIFIQNRQLSSKIGNQTFLNVSKTYKVKQYSRQIKMINIQ